MEPAPRPGWSRHSFTEALGLREGDDALTDEAVAMASAIAYVALPDGLGALVRRALEAVGALRCRQDERRFLAGLGRRIQGGRARVLELACAIARSSASAQAQRRFRALAQALTAGEAPP